MYAKPHHVPGTHGKLPFAAIITVIAPTTQSEGSHLTGVQQHVADEHPLVGGGKAALEKLKIEFSYDPAIPLLGIYPEKTLI